MQSVYFVIPSLQALLDATQGTDFGPLYGELATAADIPIEAVLKADRVFA